MVIEPITLKAANAYVREHHRHHGSVRGHKFSIALRDDGQLVGVVVVGRPSSRVLDNGTTAEVTRLTSDGTANACSMLYAAAWRACKAMGYRKCVTYVLESESGTSLQAAGWVCDGPAGGGSWDRKKRQRDDKHPTVPKVRWSITR